MPTKKCIILVILLYLLVLLDKIKLSSYMYCTVSKPPSIHETMKWKKIVLEFYFGQDIYLISSKKATHPDLSAPIRWIVVVHCWVRTIRRLWRISANKINFSVLRLYLFKLHWRFFFFLNLYQAVIFICLPGKDEIIIRYIFSRLGGEVTLRAAFGSIIVSLIVALKENVTMVWQMIW